MWKYAACFKPLNMFLASELIENLHAATFASIAHEKQWFAAWSSEGSLFDMQACSYHILRLKKKPCLQKRVYLKYQIYQVSMNSEHF